MNDELLSTVDSLLNAGQLPEPSVMLAVADAQREAEHTLAKRRAQMLYPKDKGWTDMDREIRLEADTATEKREVERWRDRYGLFLLLLDLETFKKTN